MTNAHRLTGSDIANHETFPKQRTALLTGPLQEQRQKWAELLAWTAFAMKHQRDGTDWRDFAVVARELHGDRPLSEIPLMPLMM